MAGATAGRAHLMQVLDGGRSQTSGTTLNGGCMPCIRKLIASMVMTAVTCWLFLVDDAAPQALCPRQTNCRNLPAPERQWGPSPAIASCYGMTVGSVRWSNNLSTITGMCLEDPGARGTRGVVGPGRTPDTPFPGLGRFSRSQRAK